VRLTGGGYHISRDVPVVPYSSNDPLANDAHPSLPKVMSKESSDRASLPMHDDSLVSTEYYKLHYEKILHV